MDTKNKLITVFGSVALLGVLGGGAALFFASDEPTVASTGGGTQNRARNGQPSNSVAGNNPVYTDGTYTASTDYMVPHGENNTIAATITIKDGTVKSVSTQDNYTEYESQFYIDSFKSNISSAIVGESLDGINLTRVGGASLTTNAFDAVLDTIRSKAVG